MCRRASSLIRRSRLRLNAAVTCSGSSYASCSARRRLDEIRADQQRVTLDERPANTAQHLARRRRIEVADVRTEEEHEPRALTAMRGESSETFLVRAVKGRHRVGGQRGQSRASAQERGWRDVDQMHAPESLAAALEQDRELLAVAASKLRDVQRSRQRLENLARVAREQRGLRSRDAIPGQPADRVEERRAQRVVEVTRRELARRPLQVLRDIRDEIGASRKRNPFRWKQHHASPAHRNVA